MVDHKKTGRDRGDGATRKALLQQIAVDFPGNSCTAQRERLHAAIRATGYVTTTEARLHLEIMNPSQRVTELREQDVRIDTTWAMEPSEAGRDRHRQARYVLGAPSMLGRIDPDLLALLALFAVSGLLLAGVLR